MFKVQCSRFNVLTRFGLGTLNSEPELRYLSTELKPASTLPLLFYYLLRSDLFQGRHNALGKKPDVLSTFCWAMPPK